MFEFLRNLMPGRSRQETPSPAKPGAAAAKKPSKNAAAKAGPATKRVAERPAFGQKKKAVYKPAHRAKRPAKP